MDDTQRAISDSSGLGTIQLFSFVSTLFSGGQKIARREDPEAVRVATDRTLFFWERDSDSKDQVR
jgi:hypothetical protein